MARANPSEVRVRFAGGFTTTGGHAIATDTVRIAIIPENFLGVFPTVHGCAPGVTTLSHAWERGRHRLRAPATPTPSIVVAVSPRTDSVDRIGTALRC